MELGARVCTVHQAADCKGCPIQQHCHAYQRETAAEGKAGKQPSVMDFPVKVSQNPTDFLALFLAGPDSDVNAEGHQLSTYSKPLKTGIPLLPGHLQWGNLLSIRSVLRVDCNWICRQ